MARLSTCKKCDKKLLSEEKYTYSNKTYCKSCYDIMTYENDQRNILISSLCKTMKLESLTGIMLKQLKEYRETCNYSYSGMNYTLWYYTNILNKSPQVKYGLAFIRYYYEDAKNYFLQQENIKKSMQQSEEIEVKTKVVKIHKNSNSDNKLLLNLNDLTGGKLHEF